jgi:hypothetical protein
VKAYIHCNWQQFVNCEDPEIALYEATSAITAENAHEWFRHSGYHVDQTQCILDYLAKLYANEL